jgi:hypothetical protein
MTTGIESEKLPPLGVMVGVATVRASVTLRVKAVVLITPPPVDVTVIGKLPAGVAPVVLIVNTVEHAGVQEADEKDAVAPEGTPDVENEINWLVADATLAVIELATEEPGVTDLSPEFDREKLNRDPVAGAVATGDEIAAISPNSCWKRA